MRKLFVLLMLLGATSMSFGETCNWKSTAGGSSDFTLASNWSKAYTTSSDSMRVGGPTATYPYSANLAKLATAWGAADSTVNDALAIGGYLYEGNFELACGSSTAYFRSVIVGDTKVSATEGDSTMTITSGTIRSNTDVTGAPDTGYMTVGRNNTTGITDPARAGVGYLYINSGTVAMDRITVGEHRKNTDGTYETYAGTGHIVLQNDGVINLPCARAFTDGSVVGLKINNGDFTWVDNGASTVRTGSLSLGGPTTADVASLIFQSTDNVIGQDGKGIIVFQSATGAADGKATFSASATIDVTGLQDTTSWVTLITAKNGFTFADDSILSDASVAEHWVSRTLDVTDGVAFQVCIPEPATITLLAAGLGLFIRRRK
jgi:hypothetical protein